MGEKGKRRGQKGKISASEASPAVVRGGGKAATLSPPETTSWLASLAYFFPFRPNAEPGPQLHLLGGRHAKVDTKSWSLPFITPLS